MCRVEIYAIAFFLNFIFDDLKLIKINRQHLLKFETESSEKKHYHLAKIQIFFYFLISIKVNISSTILDGHFPFFNSK